MLFSVTQFGRQYTEFARRIGDLVNEFGQSKRARAKFGRYRAFFR